MTHKMNPMQRAARFDRDAISLLVRQHVIWERDLPAALAAFLRYVAHLMQHSRGAQACPVQITRTDARV